MPPVVSTRNWWASMYQAGTGLTRASSVPKWGNSDRHIGWAMTSSRMGSNQRSKPPCRAL